MLDALGFFARHGRLVLIAGLVAGIALPNLAQLIKGYLPHFIAFLLLVSAFRIGHKQALGRLQDLPLTFGLVALYQLVLPLTFVALFALLGLSGPLATALCLMAAASSISGSPNLTILCGHDPAPALRLLVVGTALLPLTVLPTLVFLPQIGSFNAVLNAAGNLLALIGIAAFVGFTLRHVCLPNPSARAITAVDGFSAILMAFVVIGLMTAVADAIFNEPLHFIVVLAVAFGVNFGLQIAAFYGLGKYGETQSRVAFSIVAGNRNTALFIAALPVAITDPLLLFIGCYQIPMYLTPLILRRLYA